MNTTTAALLTLLLASGCSRDSGREAGRRGELCLDSAGVEILENGFPKWPATGGWRLSAAPALDIGLAAGPPEAQFYRVESAGRFPDGRVFVADGGGQDIRIFGADGGFLYAFGSEGDGPGEFRFLRRVALGSADTLWTWDHRLQRLSSFAADGTFLRSVRLGPTKEAAAVDYVGALPDGRHLVLVPDLGDMRSFREGPLPGQESYLVLLEANRMSGDTLATIRLPPMWRRVLRQAPTGTTAIVRARLPFTGASPVALAGGGLHTAVWDRPEVRTYGADGRLRRIIRYRQDRRVLSTRLRDGAERRTAGSEVPLPDAAGIVAGLLVDPLHNVWVRSVSLPGDTLASWVVLSGDGTWLGTVAMPEDLRVLEIGADYVLGTRTDDLDREHVVQFGLVR
ncbi:MAG: hypothetical protein RRA92_11275 [Gemmatimonadota bacterium]|nr:hypothetical protein [Gemmatimonadota bacterium]